ncbi:MAG TPA: sulfite exporter TauE/SafE family protein [Pseudolabrys sp.]|nr:sulfite exporter TauE/SafE family protein [Pseudolabrys sp.]
MADPASFTAALAQAVSQPFFVGAVVIALVSGLVRGFAGFGSALIYIPLISAIYGPRIAAPTLLLIDTLCALPFAIQAAPHCNVREVTAVSIAGALALPLGVMALLWVDALTLRWIISFLVLVALIALVAGWRYRGKPNIGVSLGAGALAGLGAGAVQIGAPPLLVFWLGGDNKAATVRANIMVYFIVQGTLSMALYAYNGLFDLRTLSLALLLGLPFAAALAAGAFRFHGSSDLLYRRVAYIVIGLAGIASMPMFDKLLR